LVVNTAENALFVVSLIRRVNEQTEISYTVYLANQERLL